MTDRLAANLSALEQGFALADFHPQNRFPTGMQIHVTAQEAVYSLAAFSEDEGNWVAIFLSHPTRVPVERRAAVLEAMARINYQQVIGNFDLDVTDGEMRYRVGHPTDVGELDPELVVRILGSMFHVWQRFHDALMSVVYGGASAEDALRPVFESPVEATTDQVADADAEGTDSVDMDAILKELGLTGPIEVPSARAPFENAYVVRGARLVAGEYPGDRDKESARRKVRQLLDAGITRTFDLTQPGELVSYAELLAAEAAARGVNATHQRRPIRDVDVCAPEQMRIILDEIDAELTAGETVYVHCWGGVGRTGTVIGCWLVRHGRSGDEALREVQALFESMSATKIGRHPEGSPQTPAQRRMVLEWGAIDVVADRSEPRRGARP